MVYGAQVVHRDRHRAYVLLRLWRPVTTDTGESKAAHAAYCGYPVLASYSRPPQAAAHHTARSDQGPGAPARAASADHPIALRAPAAGLLPPTLSARYTGRPARYSPSCTRAPALRIRRPEHDALAWLRAAPVPRTPAPAVPAPKPWQRAETPDPCADFPG